MARSYSLATSAEFYVVAVDQPERVVTLHYFDSSVARDAWIRGRGRRTYGKLTPKNPGKIERRESGSRASEAIDAR
jgi:hypothetical protein